MILTHRVSRDGNPARQIRQSVSEMLPSEGLLVPFVLLWLLASDAKCQNLQDMSETLNGMLADTRAFRRPRDNEDTSLIWQEYEFGTGAGNREGE